MPELPQHLVAFGHRIDETVAAFAAELDPALNIQVETFASQPQQVRRRLGGLTAALFTSVFIVAGGLLLTMGPRLGFVVASVVPLVVLSTVAVYATAGGVLHQISVAALVLSLGLLVDNAIVVAEGVQRHLDQGQSPKQAAFQAIRELAIPLGTATGTTVAAFVPMLLSSGATADFTRALPTVVILALVLSYGFALLVTPKLSAAWLRPSGTRRSGMQPWGGRLGHAIVQRPQRALGLVVVTLIGALAFIPAVRSQFFPVSDRPLVLVSVELPEGAHLDQTLQITQQLQARVQQLDEVQSVTSFVGTGPPRFYYNLRNTAVQQPCRHAGGPDRPPTTRRWLVGRHPHAGTGPSRGDHRASPPAAGSAGWCAGPGAAQLGLPKRPA